MRLPREEWKKLTKQNRTVRKKEKQKAECQRRLDIHVLICDRAEVMAHVQKRYGFNRKQLAAIFNVSEKTVSRYFTRIERRF